MRLLILLILVLLLLLLILLTLVLLWILVLWRQLLPGEGVDAKADNGRQVVLA